MEVCLPSTNAVLRFLPRRLFDSGQDCQSFFVLSNFLKRAGQLKRQPVGRLFSVGFFEIGQSFPVFSIASQRSCQTYQQPRIAESELKSLLVGFLSSTVIMFFEQEIRVF